jgi:hypothetical protein
MCSDPLVQLGDAHRRSAPSGGAFTWVKCAVGIHVAFNPLNEQRLYFLLALSG